MERQVMPLPASPPAMARCRALPAICSVAVAALGACAVGPNYTAPEPHSPIAYPVSDTALSDAAPQDRWWTALVDPLLDELVELALAGNPDLAMAEARVHQARAVARVVGADFYPSANLDARVSRDKLSLNGENTAL